MSEARDGHEFGAVAVIGLGLAGGSLARDLAAAGIRVLGYDSDPAALAAAHEEGILAHRLDASLAGLADADIVVLAVPVAAAVELLPLVAERSPGARLLTDLGSTKTGIARAAARCGASHRFVGAHPLAGDDRSGWAASRRGLYAGARVFVCPSTDCSPGALHLAEQLWRIVGGLPERIDAADHDRELAWTSHLPQALASALARTLADAGFRPTDPGAGGRGMIRLAASSPDMWSDILLENRDALAPALDAFGAMLTRTSALLERADAQELHALLSGARAWLSPSASKPDGSTPESSSPVHGDADDGVVVAFQGELGAHSEECVRSFFPEPLRPLPCRTFQDVGRAVRERRAAFGVLPVENSTAGGVIAAYEVLAGQELTVVGEVVRPIRHALVGVPRAAVGRVRRVLSHPVALAQCSGFLDARRWIEAVAFHDTAGAARQVARAGDPSLAAIAAAGTAARYGLEVLAADIQDRSDNRTRFVVVAAPGTDGPPPLPGAITTAMIAPQHGRMKSALLVDVANLPGALSGVLAPFARRSVNLTHIQSTPGIAPWTYRFIIELEADVGRGKAAEAVAELRATGATLHVLGCYPAVEAG